MPAKKARVVKLRPAVLDITEIADYLTQATNLAAARRFVVSVEKTAELLARSPGLGTLWGDESPELLDARFFPVDRFRSHLIFYRPIEGGIEMMRVLHGARNIEHLLSPDKED